MKYFLSFRTFEQLALALKTEFALIFFQARGAVAPPRPFDPASYATVHKRSLAIYSGTLLTLTHNLTL